MEGNIDIEFCQVKTKESLNFFDKDMQKKIMKLLNSKRNDKKQQEEFEYEIIIGSLLYKAGFEIEHERKFNKLTPDWYIKSNDIQSHFILEVGVLNSEQLVRDLEDQLSKLKEKIRFLPFNYELSMEYSHFIEPEFATDFINIEGILSELGIWLLNKTHKQIITNDICFKILKKTNNGIILNVDSGYGRNWRDERFISKLEEKRNAYDILTAENKLPYVIVIVSTFHSGTSLSRIRDMLLNTSYTSVKQRVPFMNIPTVSGILVIEPLSVWQAEYFANTYAHFKLPINIFNNLLKRINN